MNKSDANILKFFDEYNKYVSVRKPISPWKCLGKIGEEYGEVCEALFAHDGSNKKINKLANKGQTVKDSLEEEIADVIITCLNLTTSLGLSYDELLLKASEKMNRRALEWQKEKKTTM